jgi:malonyl-CoA O-methyltransferase
VIAALDKAAISRNFSAAAGAYDGWAAGQDDIAEGLVRRLPEGLAPAAVVELGCGTGLLSRRLLARFPGARLRGLDLAAGMIEACRRRFDGEGRARFEVADAEDPGACAGPAVDLVATSCSAQWFADPAGTFGRWARALAPGGVLAAALLVRGSYPELDRAHRAAFGVPFPGLALPSDDEAAALLARAGLAPVSVDAEEVPVPYRSAREALGSFRGIGAVLCDQPGREAMGPGRARRLLAAYAALEGERGARVTHRVVHAVARRAP